MSGAEGQADHCETSDEDSILTESSSEDAKTTDGDSSEFSSEDAKARVAFCHLLGISVPKKGRHSVGNDRASLNDSSILSSSDAFDSGVFGSGQDSSASASFSNSSLQSTEADVQDFDSFSLRKASDLVSSEPSAPLTDLPSEVLIKIVDFLTIKEKLKSERVSKRWQECVNDCLRRQHTLSTEQISKRFKIFLDAYDVRPKHDLLDKVKLYLKRMSDPATNATNLRRLILTGCLRPMGVARNLSILNCFEFPKLEHLEIQPQGPPFKPVPAFLLRSKNLLSISGLCVNPRDLSRILTELPQLKKLDIQVDNDEASDIESEDSDEGVCRTRKNFEDARCSLESLRINLLPADGIPNMVEACPGLKELRFTCDEFETNGHDCDFLPLRNLHLRLLELDYVELGDRDKSIREISAALSTADSPLSRSLEEFVGHFSFRHFSDLRLLRSFASCHSLRVLHMRPSNDGNPKSHNRVSVGSILRSDNFPHLEELSLFCVKLDGFGKGDIFDLPFLEQLTICPCEKHSDPVLAQFVAKVFRTCRRRLDKLHLYGRNFKDGFFHALAKECPQGCSSEIVVTPSLKIKCCRQIGGLEAKAQRFGLNLKFSLPDNDCECNQLPD